MDTGTTTGNALLTLLRLASLAATLALLGTLAFQATVPPPALQPRLRRLARASLWVAIGLTLASAAVAAAGGLGSGHGLWSDRSLRVDPDAAPGFLPPVPPGWMLAAQTALLLAAAPLLPRRRAGQLAAIGLVAGALGLQAILGHAGAAGAAPAGAALLHLLAASVWLGGLAPLLLAVATLPAPEAAAACQRFAPLRLAALAVAAGSAMVLAATLVGSFPALIGTLYGRLALAKLALLLVVVLVWALPRRLAPPRAQAGADPTPQRQRLLRAVVAEAVIGAAILALAAWLAATPPAIQQQPLWPFAWRPSLDVLDDPAPRHQVALALLAAGAGVALAACGMIWRRARLGLVALGGVAVVLALPRLGVLLQPAYATSFYRSPTRFAATSIVHGHDVFRANCAPCHGELGRGNGPAAASLPVHPADLTEPHLWGHRDGDLFWWVSNGQPAPDGTQAMPGFADSLSAAERWNAIDFIRANNAGAGLHDSGAWPVPVVAPALPVNCAGIPARSMADLRGSVVHVMADDDDETPPPRSPAIPPQAGYRVVTLHLSRQPAGEPPDDACQATAPAAWGAFAILAGLPPGDLGGSEFLVDPDGWLRAAWRPGTGTGWSKPEQLIAAVQQICTHPIVLETGGAHEHHD